MAEKILKYLTYIREQYGAIDKARVVMKTGFSDSKALSEEDSPENLRALRTAIKEVTGREAPQL